MLTKNVCMLFCLEALEWLILTWKIIRFATILGPPILIRRDLLVSKLSVAGTGEIWKSGVDFSLSKSSMHATCVCMSHWTDPNVCREVMVYIYIYTYVLDTGGVGRPSKKTQKALECSSKSGLPLTHNQKNRNKNWYTLQIHQKKRSYFSDFPGKPQPSF